MTEPEGASGVAYIAMELVVGRTLRAYVGDVSVAIDRRLGWLRDAAQALAAAHEAGIVHRDVKPENIMVRADGVVKVLDFGIARREQASVLGDQVPGRIAEGGGAGGVSNTTAQGVVVGTPRYMAPEQLRAESLDGRSDQFAWGVVAYELLTGTSPWPASSGEAALVTSILSVDPPPPIEHDENIPSRISDVILRALAKRRTSRFPSMKVLIAALEEGAGLKSTNRPATKESNASPMPTERLRRQRPLFVRVVVAMAAVAALAFLTIAAKRATTARGRRGEQSLPAARADACVSNSECVTKHAGAPWRCNTARHTCAELTSPDCRIDVDPRDLARDDTVWFGGVFPMRPEDGWVGEMRAAKLARAEVSGTFGSSATHAGGFRARPIGLVLCEERENPALSARHLAEDVEAPAVIGFRSSSVVRSTVQSIFLPNRILSFVSICTDPDLTKIPEVPGEPRPIWRSTLSGTGIEDSLSALISDVLEPRARSAQRGLGEGPMRVAILDIRDDASSAALTSYSRTLRFNGKSAIENGDNFKQFVIDSSDDAGAGRALSALIDFSPQIVIPNSGTSQWMPAVLAAEDRWHGPPPFYIVGYGFAPWLDFIGTNPERRRRFFATTNASSTPTNMELVLRYNVAYPQDPVMKTDAPQPSYDAFYLLAYATYALGDEPVTGPALSRALERLLPPGKPVDVGPAGIYDAFQTLRSGGRIDLNGALGSLDFDPATGEAPIDYAILCCGVDAKGRATGAIESGLVYEARTKKITGTFNCP